MGTAGQLPATNAHAGGGRRRGIATSHGAAGHCGTCGDRRAAARPRGAREEEEEGGAGSREDGRSRGVTSALRGRQGRGVAVVRRWSGAVVVATADDGGIRGLWHGGSGTERGEGAHSHNAERAARWLWNHGRAAVPSGPRGHPRERDGMGHGYGGLKPWRHCLGWWRGHDGHA